jgi:hypothetical protein
VSNNPPVEALGSATFVLKRVTGEIEIRGRTPDHLWHEQLKHPEYRFDAHTQMRPDLWAVTGMKAA